MTFETILKASAIEIEVPRVSFERFYTFDFAERSFLFFTFLRLCNTLRTCNAKMFFWMFRKRELLLQHLHTRQVYSQLVVSPFCLRFSILGINLHFASKYDWPDATDFSLRIFRKAVFLINYITEIGTWYIYLIKNCV